MKFSPNPHIVRQLVVVGVAFVVATSCAGTEQATGSRTPIATTPPLALPVTLDQDSGALGTAETTVPAESAPVEVATEAPVETPTPVPTETPTPSVVPATAVPPTAVPATAVPAISQPAATGSPAEPAPASAPATGAHIPLGNYEVVNLATGSKQDIAELSPTGATILWFWAPH